MAMVCPGCKGSGKVFSTLEDPDKTCLLCKGKGIITPQFVATDTLESAASKGTLSTWLTEREVKILYTNYRGETAWRTIRPVAIYFGETEWHKGLQWLLKAHDHEKKAERDFAIKDIKEWRVDSTQPELTKEERAYRRGALQAIQYLTVILQDKVTEPHSQSAQVIAEYTQQLIHGRDSEDPMYLGKYLDTIRVNF